MRQGQPNQHHNNNNNNKNRMRNRNRKGPNPLTRSYESNGGDVKIRGTALHVAEKYVQLARDAQASSDRVAAENYLQHAEHYYRIVAAAQAQMPQPQQIYRSDDDDGEEDADGNPIGGYTGNGDARNGYRDDRFQTNRQPQPQQSGSGQGYGAAPEQPYANGNQPNGQEQPQVEGAVYPPADQNGDDGQVRQQGANNGQAGQGGQGGQNAPGGGNFRHRRRRPYRDNFNNNERGNQAAPQGGDSPDAGGDPPGDD